ncbi:MAG: hypothetical protein IT204_22380 [Fimbriimonadaceae bacterium]|nr:hypothetical protein [Fimbriimonadaceae bacterium]
MRWPLLALLTSLLGAAGQDPAGLSWQPGELFLRVDGRPQVVLGRNPAERQTAEWVAHFDAMAAAGERLARIHLCWMPAGEVPGEISPAMLAGWDALLTAAAERGLAVLPVLGAWYRDARCRAPRWPLAPCADQWIELPAAGDWELTWIDPVDGRATTTRQTVDSPPRLALPPFTGSLALWATRRAGAPPGA